MKEIKVKITFTEELLGTASANPEVHAEFIASKAPDAKSTEEEVAAIGVEEYVEKSMTVFPRNAEGKPIIYDYQIRGHMKESCGFLRKVKGSLSSKIKAYKKEIDGLVFVKPRMIPIEFEGEIGNCQRPLRGQTAQGERVSLAISEQVPAGATMEFSIVCLSDDHEKAVKEWLDYGKFSGIGQWRNSGKGRFNWELIEE
jgi:hypothetical protein